MISPEPAAAVSRMQQLMTSSPVPAILTELLATADGEPNRELNAFQVNPSLEPKLLDGRRIGICRTHRVGGMEILGSRQWLAEHGVAIRVISAPRPGRAFRRWQLRTGDLYCQINRFILKPHFSKP